MKSFRLYITSLFTAAFHRTLALPVVMLVIGVLSLVPDLASGQTCLTNPVACENALPGSTGWQISGTGDDNLQGYATDMSVNIGQTVFFKVKSNASNYHLDIYRMGYYGGTGARLVATVNPSVALPQSQPACFNDAATKLVDCGNWAVSASWQVPSTAVSGIYFARLVRNDTGGASHIVFVVRDDARQSDILFQTSDSTWQAYNYYGGHSFYGGSGTWDNSNRAYKLSYNRPFITKDLESASWVFYAEYPMVRWMEANGFDVSYFSGVDTARNGALILNHKVFLSIGHDEYWSGPSRSNVEAARDAGVHLALFSGNLMMWKTRWENSIDGTNTPYRTLVSYKESLNNAKIDPSPIWTGLWRDPRFSPPSDGGRPENALVGTFFLANDPGTVDPAIKVPAADGKMRFWRNTSIASLAPNQTATLPTGTLGYEWDTDVDNGFRPAGLFRLSTATYFLTNSILLDYSGTFGSGDLTHHMTLYRAPSGALVFSAGTVQWSWGLDSNHDTYGPHVGSATDSRMQQATVNLFVDMGAQPATLQAGMVPATQSTDTAAPTSAITFPASGATLLRGAQLNITGTAADQGGGVVGGVEISVNSGVTWSPANGRESWSYSWTPSLLGAATIAIRAVDDSGNIQTPLTSINVNIVNVIPDTTPPTVSSITPANGASGLAINGTVAVTFSEAMNATTISTDTIELYDTSTSALMAATVSYNATTRVATLTPAVPLINSTSYTVNIWGGPSEPDPRVKDAAGNPLAATFTSSFTTASSAVSVTLFPTSTSILTGTLNGGNAAALTSNNNVYFAVNSTTSGTRTTAWYGSFSAVPSTLSNLRVNYRGNNSANCAQTVAIWRWSDSTWVQLDSRSVSSTEISINNLAPSGTLANYVSGAGELRVRVQCTRSTNFIARGEVMSISYDVPVGPPPPDTTAPVRSNGAPSVTLAFGTTQTTLSLFTNEYATCRYATSAGVNYDSMAANGFSTTGGTAHNTLVTGLVNGGSYNFFVRCRDASINANTNGDDYPISFAVSSQPTQTFQASVDFSATQGFRNWYYLYGTGTQMAFASPNWKGNETYLLLYPNGGHPGMSSDAIRRWKAPQAGTINITGRAFDLDGRCGSGVSVSIRKNGTNLWQQAIANGNSTGFNFNQTTTVVTGDNIDFVINRGADNFDWCDATGFNPTITLIP